VNHLGGLQMLDRLASQIPYIIFRENHRFFREYTMPSSRQSEPPKCAASSFLRQYRLDAIR
jgi:hypothetical protein